MSSLQIIDVFDSYYEGRRTSFATDAAETDASAQRDERKLRVKVEKPQLPVSRAA